MDFIIFVLPYVVYRGMTDKLNELCLLSAHADVPTINSRFCDLYNNVNIVMSCCARCRHNHDVPTQYYLNISKR